MEPVKLEASLPPPSPELVLVRTGAQALIRTLGKRKGERFVREWVTLLADLESVALLFPTRPRGERAAVATAQAEAVAWIRQLTPALLASVPPE